MKKKCLLFAFLVALVLAFTGCSDPESKTYDGKITVENGTDGTINVQLIAINATYKTGQDRYDNRKNISAIKSVKVGASVDFDYDFSKFQDSNETIPAIMVNKGGNNWYWYTYGSYYFYQQNTLITVTDNPYGGFYQTSSVSEYTDYEPVHSDSDVCDGEFTVTNESGKDCWVEFIGTEDTSWNTPVALTPRVFLKNGESTTYKYYLSDFNNLVLARLIYRADDMGTFCWGWTPSAANFPNKITINEPESSSYWPCTTE